MRILFWRFGALIALTLGIVGVVVPILPTVPFLLVAAWAASRGWPALEAWLVRHPICGPYIADWRKRGAVPPRAKRIASVMMLISAVGLQFTAISLWLRIAAPLAMLCVAVWLWMRPES